MAGTVPALPGLKSAFAEPISATPEMISATPKMNSGTAEWLQEFLK
jgi:hypothetical protein